MIPMTIGWSSRKYDDVTLRPTREAEKLLEWMSPKARGSKGLISLAEYSALANRNSDFLCAGTSQLMVPPPTQYHL